MKDFFINGAVLKLDRRGTIELMNDAQFLLENHIMQPEAATTPLRQLYFVVQTMIMDPQNAHLTCALFQAQALQLTKLSRTPAYLDLIKSACALVERENYFETLKLLRKSFSMEDELIQGDEAKKQESTRAA